MGTKVLGESKVVCQFSAVQGVGTPNPQVLQGSIVYTYTTVLYRAHFNLLCFFKNVLPQIFFHINIISDIV